MLGLVTDDVQAAYRALEEAAFQARLLLKTLKTIILKSIRVNKEMYRKHCREELYLPLP